MARASFGGGVADFVFASTSGGLVKLTSAALTFWTAETGGTQHTDLLLSGAPVTSIPVGADGQVPTFQGPDEVYTMWADAGGARVLVAATGDQVSATVAARQGAEAARAETQALRDGIVGDLGTTDSQTATLINSPGSLTDDALKANSRALASEALGYSFPEDEGAKGDGVEQTTGAMTSASAVLTATTNVDWAGFVAADVGKLIRVAGAGVSGADLATTIASYQSATQVTLSVAASTTVSAATFSYATDDSTALQAWMDNAVRGRGVKGLLQPNKAYAFSQQLIVPSDAHAVGAGSNPGINHQGGTELWWFGASGTNAVVTGLTADTDWSRGTVRGFRVVNKAKANAAGFGLHFRNPQNGSWVEDVIGIGFPDGGVLIEETKTTGTLGATPGFVTFRNVWGIGGRTPVKIRVGSQPVAFDMCAADTDALTDAAAFVVAEGPIPSTGPRATVSFRDCKAEIATSTPTQVPPWLISTDAAVTFDSCQAQHNSAAMGTISSRGAVEYSPSAGAKKWGRIKMSQFSSWNFAYSYRNLSPLAFDLPNPGTTAPWVTNFDGSKI